MMDSTKHSTPRLRFLTVLAVVAIVAAPTAAWASADTAGDAPEAAEPATVRGDIHDHLGGWWKGRPPHHRPPRTVQVFETDATETLNDLDGDGFTPGDFIIERATLLDPDTGEQVGEAIEDIRIVGVTEPPSDDNPLGDWELVMDATFVLEDGNLTFGGYGAIADFAADGAEFPIRGGTGRYSGARGTATVALSEVGGEVGPLITFELTRR